MTYQGNLMLVLLKFIGKAIGKAALSGLVCTNAEFFGGQPCHKPVYTCFDSNCQTKVKLTKGR